MAEFVIINKQCYKIRAKCKQLVELSKSGNNDGGNGQTTFRVGTLDRTDGVVRRKLEKRDEDVVGQCLTSDRMIQEWVDRWVEYVKG